MANGLLLVAAEELLEALNQYYDSGEYIKPFKSEEIADCVVMHAAAAGVATMAGGVLPGVGAAAAMVASTGAVWAMYIKMANMIGAPLGRNTLKVLSSAVVSNLAMNAAAYLAFTFIPGVGIIATGVITFATVYAAGLIFLTVLTRLFKVQRQDVDDMTSEEWKESVKDAVSNINVKAIFKEAKDLFMNLRRSGRLNTMGKDLDLDPSDDESHQEMEMQPKGREESGNNFSAPMDKLRQARQLADEGLITEEDFLSLKRKIVEQM